LGSNPLKKYCQNRLTNAVRDGRLINPDKCDCCGIEGKVEGHHWNYTEINSLDVFWLCKSCHEKEHECIEVGGYPEDRKLLLQE